MKDGFDYNPPEGPLDCCSGMSRHARLMQEPGTAGKAQTRVDDKAVETNRPAPKRPIGAVTAPRG